MIINHLTKRTLGLLACFLGLISTAMAQTTFFATQTDFVTRQSILYRFTATSAVTTFLLQSGLSGMTTVPCGVSVGNMNGGARGGDIIGFTGFRIYRLDDAFGTNPHLVQIGVTNTLPASPVFVGKRLFSVGGAFPLSGGGPSSVYISEADPLTFTELWRESTGILWAGSGGMFHAFGDTFRFVEHTTDRLYEYTLGSGTVATNLGPTAIHDYVGLEQFEGTVYAAFAMPQTISGTRRFGFGTINPSTGAYSEQVTLDSYRDGITALTVATPLGFEGFLSPIGGADTTGGSFDSPIDTFNGKSIPVKFRATCCGNDVLTGIHTLQAIKYTSATASEPPLNAASINGNTIGNQFSLTGNQWHFNLDTSVLSKGTWKLVATLSDGSTHFVWIKLN